MNAKFDLLLNHMKQATGFQFKINQDWVEIEQQQDKKIIKLDFQEIDEVLIRDEKDTKTFLQINFVDGKKILITDELIGFKPLPNAGLKFDKLPKVVTTTDLISVFEAAEEALSAGMYEEVESLKQVFQAILRGGEHVGFDLKSEREWFTRLLSKNASA